MRSSSGGASARYCLTGAGSFCKIALITSSAFTPQIFAQRLAVNKLGGDEVCAIRFANLENSEDVGMVEGGGGASFLFKTAHAFSLASDLGRQQFERDFTVQTRVFGQVNFAHPARAEFVQDAVM